MVTVWFGVGQFLSGAMGQLYPGGDTFAKCMLVLSPRDIWKFPFQKVMIFPGGASEGGTHMSNFKHLTQEERNIIEQRLNNRESFKSIARELGKVLLPTYSVPQ